MTDVRLALGAAIALGLVAGSEARETLWQTNSAGNDVHVIDVASGEVLDRLVVGPEPHGIAATADGATLFLTLERNRHERGELLWIDPRRRRIVDRLEVGPEPHEIEVTADGRWVYVPCRDGRYWVVDAHARRVVKRLHTGGRPHNTTASPDGRHLYLSPMGKPKRVFVVDTEAGHEIVGEIPFAGSVRPAAVSEDGRLLLQQIDGLNGFQAADVRRSRVIATIEHSTPLGWFLLPIARLGWLDGSGLHRCHGLAVRPGVREVWSACGPRLNVHRIGVTDFPEVARVELPGDAYWLTFSSDGRFAFVALSGLDEVVKVDAANHRVSMRLPVGSAPKRNLVLDLSGGG